MNNNRLQSEITAPIFNLTDVFGRQINLEDYKGKKTLIGFYRHAGCPFCNMRVHALTKLYAKKELNNMEMIFFFESKKEIILRSTFHKEVSPVPIISDPENTWYKAYGIEKSGYKSAVSHITTFVQTAIRAGKTGVPMHLMAGDESIKTMPAEFLLDEDLIIRKLHYSERLNSRMLVDEIISFANGKEYDKVI
ncbi:peroxiredoxin-like family protein [Fulvivirga lutea]|uniref:thioredoxin-dependent peroxiredoxin n=1 Tax=Fulvivirga lutea TaxID=2810512 RepID=A0A974WJS0_9BACT|nr:peroxiredoxin-like family protein [Fulvivirga lutea]QSE96648.1 AhpC/TSA family protein [Fulvivirga lutea]